MAVRRLTPLECISIHAPRVGSDHFRSNLLQSGNNFNPRSPCGERPAPRAEIEIFETISIHAPRVGSDLAYSYAPNSFLGFQSTLPVWGATPAKANNPALRATFQSTLPVWGATLRQSRPRRRCQNFNPRSPCGERQRLRREKATLVLISIHAPRVGSDIFPCVLLPPLM